MVISHSNNFIFLRVPKNASSSLAEYFVRNFCNTNDAYTAVNDCGILTHNVSKQVIRKHNKQTHYIHMTLQELIDDQIITEEKAQSMKKIIVLRNPIHRQISLYFFLCRLKRTNPSPQDFRDKFKNGCHESDSNNAIRQMDYVKINGVQAKNIELWDYNNIDQKLYDMSIGRKINTKLSKHKSDRRPKVDIEELVNEYYDDDTRKAVEIYYEEDIEFLNRIKKL